MVKYTYYSSAKHPREVLLIVEIDGTLDDADSIFEAKFNFSPTRNGISVSCEPSKSELFL